MWIRRGVAWWTLCSPHHHARTTVEMQARACGNIISTHAHLVHVESSFEEKAIHAEFIKIASFGLICFSLDMVTCYLVGACCL
jgi:hypothetical protein